MELRIDLRCAAMTQQTTVAVAYNSCSCDHFVQVPHVAAVDVVVTERGGPSRATLATHSQSTGRGLFVRDSPRFVYDKSLYVFRAAFIS